MNKIFKVSSISLAMLVLAFFVSAEETNTTLRPSPSPVKPRPSAVMEKREEVKQNLEQKREELRQNMELRKEELKQNVEERRETLKQEMEQKREELKDRMEQKREELKTRIETKREELKSRLTKIKDERKKQVVERIDKSLDAINERITSNLLKVLEKLEDILVRIGERTDKAESNGVNVSSVDSAIVSAQTAINDAKAAVEAQSAKTYTIIVSTEDKLKSDVGRARQALHADLKLVQEKVKVARNAVHEVARAYAKAHGRDLPSPSVSPSSSPMTSASPTTTP